MEVIHRVICVNMVSARSQSMDKVTFLETKVNRGGGISDVRCWDVKRGGLWDVKREVVAVDDD